MNDWQKTRFAGKMVEAMFKSVTGKRIALLGLAFKKDTGACVLKGVCWREGPRSLADRGGRPSRVRGVAGACV